MMLLAANCRQVKCTKHIQLYVPFQCMRSLFLCKFKFNWTTILPENELEFMNILYSMRPHLYSFLTNVHSCTDIVFFDCGPSLHVVVVFLASSVQKAPNCVQFYYAAIFNHYYKMIIAQAFQLLPVCHSVRYCCSWIWVM